MVCAVDASDCAFSVAVVISSSLALSESNGSAAAAILVLAVFALLAASFAVVCAFDASDCAFSVAVVIVSSLASRLALPPLAVSTSLRTEVSPEEISATSDLIDDISVPALCKSDCSFDILELLVVIYSSSVTPESTSFNLLLICVISDVFTEIFEDRLFNNVFNTDAIIYHL